MADQTQTAAPKDLAKKVAPSESPKTIEPKAQRAKNPLLKMFWSVQELVK